MKIRIHPDLPSLPLPPAEVPVGSALPLCIEGVPSGAAAVAVAVTNADGVAETVAASKRYGLWWAMVPASHFASVGAIGRGLKVAVSLEGEPVIYMGDISVVSATPGDPSGAGASYVPRTPVDELAEGSTIKELRNKVNELARVVSGTTTIPTEATP